MLLEFHFLILALPSFAFIAFPERTSPNHRKVTSSRFSSVQSLSGVPLFVTPWTATWKGSLSITNSQSLLKLMFIKSVIPSNHLILCHPLLFLPSIFPSIRVFSSESVFPIRWPEYWSFNFNISLSSEYSGLTDLITLQCKSRVFSHTTVQKHQFFSAVKNPPTMWESQETWV